MISTASGACDTPGCPEGYTLKGEYCTNLSNIQNADSMNGGAGTMSAAAGSMSVGRVDTGDHSTVTGEQSAAGAAGAADMHAAGANAMPAEPAAGTNSVAGNGSTPTASAAGIGGGMNPGMSAGAGMAGGVASMPPTDSATMVAGQSGGAMNAIAGVGATTQPVPGAGSSPPTVAGFKPKCTAKGAEVALIGDDWIKYSLGESLTPRLEELARTNGALSHDDSYNDQAVPGTSLAGDGLGVISDQWAPALAAAAKAGTSVRSVVMDGGSSDLFLGSPACLPNGAMLDQDTMCQRTAESAVSAAKTLVQRMKSDGVSQVVYFFIPHVPAGGWDVIDYALPKLKSACESFNGDAFRCYFVDTRETFQGAGNTGGAKSELIGADGIHPSAKGADLLADLIWRVMKDNCVAQSPSSGCCTP